MLESLGSSLFLGFNKNPTFRDLLPSSFKRQALGKKGLHPCGDTIGGKNSYTPKAP